MKNFIRTFVVAILFFAVTEASAQISIGGGLWYGSDISSVGISVNGRYEFNEEWSAAPTFTYFLEKDHVKWSVLDLDVNYAITEIENVGSLYGIGGLAITFWKVDFGKDYHIDMGDYGDDYPDFGDYIDFDDYDLDDSASDIGVNLGIGLKIEAGENLAIAPEIKYTISDGGYFRIGAKIFLDYK